MMNNEKEMNMEDMEQVVTLTGLTSEECVVLDFLWLAESDEDLEIIAQTFGKAIVAKCEAMLLANLAIAKAKSVA